MADNKIDKALYGPSVTEVALGAVLGLLAGVVLACVYLVFKPVSQVKDLPKEPLRSVVYYIPGNEGSAKSRGWQGKKAQFLAGTSITMVEDELNAWSASTAAPAPAAAKPGPKPGAKPPAKPKPGEKAKQPPVEAKVDEGKPVGEGIIIPYAPNFKVVGDQLQIGLKCTLNWYGMTYDTTVVATGRFSKSGDQVVFVPSKLYLGSCPVHYLPALPGLLVSQIVAKEKVPDEMRTAWTKVSEVTIEEGAVKFTLQ